MSDFKQVTGFEDFTPTTASDGATSLFYRLRKGFGSAAGTAYQVAAYQCICNEAAFRIADLERQLAEAKPIIEAAARGSSVQIAAGSFIDRWRDYEARKPK